MQVRTFFGRFDSFDDEAQAFVLVDGAHLPPEIERGSFYGVDWADGRGYVQNAGATARWEGGAGFGASAGLFSSTLAQERAFSLLFESVDVAGAGDRTLIGRRDQKTASTSGEIAVHRTFSNASLSHRVRLSLRGRKVDARYGGGAVVPLGSAVIGVARVVPEMDVMFGDLSRDEIHQTTIGIGYDSRWRSGELSVGLQKSDYRKEVRVPGRSDAIGRDSPRLTSAAAAWYLSDRVAFYGSFTEGLEESGIAPDNAANRGQVLPALRTHQLDAGLRIALTPRLRLVSGVFTVTKAYFNLDLPDGEFRELGDVRHRGLELSLSGTLSPRFDVLAGAVLMDPEVTGAAVEDGRIGAEPLGQPRSRSLIGINYRPERLENWLLDATITRIGARTANLAATLDTPAVTTLNAGFRRSFKVNSAPAVLRVQVINITDEFAWQVNRSGAFEPNQERTLVGSLAVDF